MKKIFVSLLLISLIFVVGCGKKSSDTLLGTWKGTTEDGLVTTFTFEKNNKVSYSNAIPKESNGTYKIKGDNVTIKLDIWRNEITYKFEIKDNKLSLIPTVDDGIPSYKNMIKK